MSSMFNLSSMDATGSNRPDDETLAYVGHLNHLTSLSLSGTAITDAGLAHLEGLKDLRRLRIDHTRVTDARAGQPRKG